MNGYWNKVNHRATATLVVWKNHFPSIVLGNVTADEFVARNMALPDLAQALANTTQRLDEARQARDDAAARLLLAVRRLPSVIEGSVDASAELFGDLAKVSGMQPTSFARMVARGRALAPVWAAANAWRAAQNPPRPPIEAAGFTQATFLAALDGFGALEQAVANAEKTESGARETLRTASRDLEQLCIRFLKAAWGLAGAGSEAEASLATIPTLTRTGQPGTLRLGTLSQGGAAGLQVLVAWPKWRAPGEGEVATLEYRRLDLDGEWSTQPCAPEGNALGPFAAGETVRVRTRMTNSNGTRCGRPKDFTLTAPQG
jgi:hypothetical protein